MVASESRGGKAMAGLGRKTFIALLAVATALVVVGTAAAHITFNADGTGFVGKVEVRKAFGWTNRQFQANAADLTFTYGASVGIATISCAHWENGVVVDSWTRDTLSFNAAAEAVQLRGHPGHVTGFVLSGPVAGSEFNFAFSGGDTLPAECFGSDVVEGPPPGGTGWSVDTFSDVEAGQTWLFATVDGQTVALARLIGGEPADLPPGL